MVHVTMELTLSYGIVYGGRYTTVKPVFAEIDEIATWYDMEDWCVKVFGNIIGSIWADPLGMGNPDKRWFMNNSKFWFRDEKDVTMFLLRWS